MKAEALIARLRAAREFKVEVEPGKFLKVRRPTEAHMGRYRLVDAAAAASCVVGWHDITEADVLGPTVGAADKIDFDDDLVLELLLDRGTWAEKVAKAVADAIRRHIDAKGLAEKN